MKLGQIVINKEDIVGKRLGKLEVVKYDRSYYSNTSGGRRVRHSYICRCECGTVKSIRRSSLINDWVHSCGCSKRERHNGNKDEK